MWRKCCHVQRLLCCLLYAAVRCSVDDDGPCSEISRTRMGLFTLRLGAGAGDSKLKTVTTSSGGICNTKVLVQAYDRQGTRVITYTTGLWLKRARPRAWTIILARRKLAMNLLGDELLFARQWEESSTRLRVLLHVFSLANSTSENCVPRQFPLSNLQYASGDPAIFSAVL